MPGSQDDHRSDSEWPAVFEPHWQHLAPALELQEAKRIHGFAWWAALASLRNASGRKIIHYDIKPSNVFYHAGQASGPLGFICSGQS